MSIIERRSLISPEHQALSIASQCKLLNLQRSCYYFKPKGESLFNQSIMNLIDRKFLDCPFYGVDRMTAYLNKDLGCHVNNKRIRRLYRVMNLRTIYPKKNLSKANAAHHKYPYLLKGLKIDRPGQVWQADITYIPMFRGFMYMFAIIDVYSRKIVGWSISNTMTVEWCRDVLLETIEEHGTPGIFNTDQGSQFTSPIFTKALKDSNVSISMDGKGRALDNVFIERFWRSLKQEYIYLNPPNGGMELFQGIKRYVEFYNNERRHRSMDDLTPNEVFYQNNKKVS
ncbi:MAG: IS3 family transposase [Candidatus Pedobacter colombiensis]|uniref:IS3 family transposase n=1 Tax=Candidatus Pedobacter colombiensis TaxID=3121371 RepID=A0AAJ6B833_9SPHI|nr:IS3 family transposase [Pedobacter sp.]WEK18005.1 MAG: IS3 family transposase [Pedobacter sp.]WEK18282.1 MAG: IS3 family transposase [Pedobacter sp.]WEK18521.1 MAG: IS3 family transposase [Pedobacter sp.]WEK20494.1 MAG: IS3 family transposase [Pedobacter sp.]WEK21525.1 MAG: IS3 family transposase [Pedobacter sp.]